MPTPALSNTPDVPVVAPRGEIDLATSRELGSQLGELAGEPGIAAVLDLSEVTFLDSVGLGVVLKAAGRFRRQAKRLVIVVPPGQVLRLLELSGVGERLALASTRDEAIAAATVR
jgi:anti-sigma B factor antagonist